VVVVLGTPLGAGTDAGAVVEGAGVEGAGVEVPRRVRSAWYRAARSVRVPSHWAVWACG
jgi:hypothetical protein